MIATPFDFRSLYEKQLEANDKLKREIKNVIIDTRDEFAMAALPALIRGGWEGKYVVEEAYKIAELVLKYKKDNPCGLE